MFRKKNRSKWGPLLITIGPHLSGKTYFLESLREQMEHYRLEDLDSNYEKIFLVSIFTRFEGVSSDQIVSQLLHRKSVPLSNGVGASTFVVSNTNREHVLLALFFAEMIADQDMESALHALFHDQDTRDAYFEALLLVRDVAKEAKEKMIDSIEIKQVDKVPGQMAAALRECRAGLKKFPGIVAWDFCNLNAELYREVMWFASKYQRVIRFVRWGVELPTLTLQEIFRRNFTGFFHTGRLVDSKKLTAQWRRGETMINSGSLDSHVSVSRLAGYDMDLFGRVAPLLGTYSPATGARRPELTKMPDMGDGSTPWSQWTNEGILFPLDGRGLNELSLNETRRNLMAASHRETSGTSDASMDEDIFVDPAAEGRLMDFQSAVEQEEALGRGQSSDGFSRSMSRSLSHNRSRSHSRSHSQSRPSSPTNGLRPESRLSSRHSSRNSSLQSSHSGRLVLEPFPELTIKILNVPMESAAVRALAEEDPVLISSIEQLEALLLQLELRLGIYISKVTELDAVKARINEGQEEAPQRLAGFNSSNLDDQEDELEEDFKRLQHISELFSQQFCEIIFSEGHEHVMLKLLNCLCMHASVIFKTNMRDLCMNRPHEFAYNVGGLHYTYAALEELMGANY